MRIYFRIITNINGKSNKTFLLCAVRKLHLNERFFNLKIRLNVFYEVVQNNLQPNLKAKALHFKCRLCFNILAGFFSPSGRPPDSTSSLTELRRKMPMDRNRSDERDLIKTDM